MVPLEKIENNWTIETCSTKARPVISITGVFKHVISQSAYLKGEKSSLCCLVSWCTTMNMDHTKLRSLESKL